MMTNDSYSDSTTTATTMVIPPFHSLPFPVYYRTECQDKYSTSRLAHHVAYNDNECASSLQLTPCFDNDNDNESSSSSSSSFTTQTRTQSQSYQCKAFIHGEQYSRKVRMRCFAPWVDAAGFADATLRRST